MVKPTTFVKFVQVVERIVQKMKRSDYSYKDPQLHLEETSKRCGHEHPR